MTGLTVTVAICTRNRAEYAYHAVQSLLAQDIAPERMDILVVDNGSTDDTAAMASSFRDVDSRVRYELVPEPGLSRARNHAVETARGDVIAFLDDDAVAVPVWARVHLGAFEDAEVVATGGPISLVWPGRRPPPWLPGGREGMFAGLDLGDRVQDFPPPAIPFGANMAFRRDVFDSIAPFETGLGRQGRGLLSGEERELCERLRAAGGRLVYLPAAAVDHHVLPGRDSRNWFLRRCYDHGRSTVVLDLYRPAVRTRSYWLGRAGWRTFCAARFASLATVRWMRGRPPAERTSALADLAEACGTALESMRAVRHPTR